ncbi:transporter, MotA/TolQ/ExbB proton channel family protein [Rhodobacteraceae bacterium KLH11]|nr:transporter, MotA/TolQ/ExbB proton channel family protein [Rhodobacteraceae bacterium KLH11]
MVPKSKHESKPVRRLFAPSPIYSCFYFVVSILVTVLLYLFVNNEILVRTKDLIGTDDAVAQIVQVESATQSKTTAEALQTVDNVSDVFKLSVAWDLFEAPLHYEILDEECKFTDAATLPKLKASGLLSLAEFVKRLACVETVFHANPDIPILLADNLGIPERCVITKLTIGPARREGNQVRDPSLRKREAEALANALTYAVLGVEPRENPAMLWMPKYAPPPDFGRFASQEVSRNSALQDPKLFNMLFANAVPGAVLADPECRPMRDVLDGFSISVIKGFEQVVQDGNVLRWISRAMNGPIQFVIIVLAIFGSLRLILRRINQDRLFGGLLKLRGRVLQRSDVLSRYNNDLASAETAMLRVHDEVDLVVEKWLLEIIPMIGFLGTVIGMIAAMDLVGVVVSARPGAELNSAMGAITNELSVAFFTTFIGLIAAIILGIWNTHRSASEVAAIRDFLHGSSKVEQESSATSDSQKPE